MLGMLRRSRERREAYEATCPCKQTCRCHAPSPDTVPEWVAVVLLLALVSGVGIAAYFSPPPKPVQRTVRVGEQTCKVVFVKTDRHCDGLGRQQRCWDEGYDRAVCP